MFTCFAPNISDLSTFATGVVSEVFEEVTQGGKPGSVCCGKGAWIGFSSFGSGTWEPLLELARHWFQYRRATGFVAAAIAAGEGAPGLGFLGACVIEI